MVCVCVYTEANLYNCVQVMPVNHIDVLVCVCVNWS